jgi:hypothetical protein
MIGPALPPGHSKLHKQQQQQQQQREVRLPLFEGYPSSFLWWHIMRETSTYDARRPVSGIVLGSVPILGIEQAVRYDSRSSSRGHDLGIKITGT